MKNFKMITILGMISLSAHALALQCLPVYKGYQWDMAIMGNPETLPTNNDAHCLYNKNGDPNISANTSYDIKGTFRPANPDVWANASDPFTMICINNVVDCAFNAVSPDLAS